MTSRGCSSLCRFANVDPAAAISGVVNSEMRAAASHDSKLFPIRVSDVEPQGLLRGIVYLDLVGLHPDKAAEALMAAARVALGERAKPAAHPAFPGATSIQHAPRFPALLPAFVAVQLEIVAGDILDYRADLVAFKHANGFYGADASAARRLRRIHDAATLSPARNEMRIIPTHGALGAPNALFVGVGSLADFDYRRVREYSTAMVDAATRDPAMRHVATTAHGRGIGLDDKASFLSQVAGILVGLGGLDGPTHLKRITVVEHDRERVDEFGRALEETLVEIPYASLIERSDAYWRFGIGALSQESEHVPSIGLLERVPEHQPHVFIAYPFELEDHARYGLERPAHDLGYLARLIAEQAFTGEVLERIKQQIEAAAVVVGVLTNANPNVFLEIGYAWGRGRPTVLVAQDDQELHFDVRGQKILRYKNITELEQKFTAEMAALKQAAAI